MMLKIFRAALQYSPAVLGATLVLANSALALEAPAGAKEAENQAAVADQTASLLASNNSTIAEATTSAPVNFVAQSTQTGPSTSVPAAGSLTEETPATVQPSVNSLESGKGLSTESDPMGQLRSVNELSDVRPTDWAYEALRNLVERYNCIAGYPDRTFRGNRALTRYEFAAGLNACLDSITGLVGQKPNAVTKEDLATLQRLLNEFQTEMATLRGRVDALEARTRTLEETQFSTTTKLKGEVIFGATDIIGKGGAEVVPHFSYRARLNLNTSFTGKDLLYTRLQAGNMGVLNYAPNSNMDRLSFDTNTSNNVQLDKLFYRFPLGKATVTLDANAAEYYENMYSFNPLLQSSGSGSVSRFGRFNPIYRQGGGQGVTLNYDFSKTLGLSLGYQAPNGNDPQPSPTGGGGFYHGSYAALGQLAFRPSDSFALGLTYVHSYSRNGSNLSGGTGSSNANSPFGTIPTSANHYGLEASLRLSPRFTVSGWGGYTKAATESDVVDQKANIWNWAVTLGFPDLGKKGNLLAFVVGMPPKVTDSDLVKDGDTSLHLEALYRYQVTDNISITPGLFVITNPNHDNNNETDFVGTIRTTFTF